MLKKRKIGFIGAGNMAEAIIKGLLNASILDSKSVWATDVRKERLDAIKSDFKINVTQDNRELVKKCDVLVLAVKPQNMEEVCQEIGDLVTEKKLVISVAAGVAIETIESFLQGKKKKKIAVVRTMPNTPAVVQEGATALSAGKHVSKSDMEVAHGIFKAIGKTVDVVETHLDAVTGLSGSGPAYIFTIIEALSDAGVKVGLPRDVSDILALQTMVGSARLAQETGKHPGELKAMVTSPGGTTIYGVHALEEGGIRSILMNAVEQATKRSRELGQASDKKDQKKKK